MEIYYCPKKTKQLSRCQKDKKVLNQTNSFKYELSPKINSYAKYHWVHKKFDLKVVSH